MWKVFDIFQSKGVKRTLASALATAALVSMYIPALAPYTPILVKAAGALGAVGIGHAMAPKKEPKKRK